MKNKLHFLFLIGLVTLLTGCSFGGDYKAPISKNIGDELQCSEYEKYTVTVDRYDFKTGDIDSYHTIPDGHEWIGVVVTVKNMGEDEMQVHVDNFNIINSNGERIKPDTLTYNVWGINPLDNVNLVSGGTSSGYINFSNNSQDNSNLKLEFVCDRNSFISTDDTRYEIPLN